MSRHLVALFVTVELLDFATYLQAPHLEANPAMAALPPMGVAIAKLAGVCLALVVISRIRTASLQSLALAIGIAIGAFGLGANVASLSIVAAAETPRPAPVPAPMPRGTGFEQDGGWPSVAPERTAAPSTSAAGPSPLPVVAIDTRVAPRRVVPDRISSGTTLRGRASWVRASLGARYMAARLPRGTILRVCGPLACFTGVVTDYGPSKRKHPDRIVDLSRARFSLVCGDPVTLGTCPVQVWVVDVRAPETDTDG